MLPSARRELVTWEDVDRLIDHLIPQFRREFTAMVMITRGGIVPGGLLARIAGADVALVNSLHGQGIRTLAPGCVVEARARDGLIEAIRLDAPDPFLLAVQWHPEWKVRENPFYLGIFQAFAAACRERAATRN